MTSWTHFSFIIDSALLYCLRNKNCPWLCKSFYHSFGTFVVELTWQYFKFYSLVYVEINVLSNIKMVEHKVMRLSACSWWPRPQIDRSMLVGSNFGSCWKTQKLKFLNFFVPKFLTFSWWVMQVFGRLLNSGGLSSLWQNVEFPYSIVIGTSSKSRTVANTWAQLRFVISKIRLLCAIRWTTNGRLHSS